MELLKPKLDLFEKSRQSILELEKLFECAGEAGFPMDLDLSQLPISLKNQFSIFVCGEFNSGKSTLLNEIAGEEIAATGILPTTSKIMPLQTVRVKGLTFVDSPGTNSIIDSHQSTTEDYLKRADVILFVTSVERPLTDSEVQFLTVVKDKWSRKVIVVLNKIDFVKPS